jgi:hypothetical protein
MLTDRERSVLSICLWDKRMDHWALVCGAGFYGKGKSRKAAAIIDALVNKQMIERFDNDNKPPEYKVTKEGMAA